MRPDAPSLAHAAPLLASPTAALRDHAGGPAEAYRRNFREPVLAERASLEDFQGMEEQPHALRRQHLQVHVKRRLGPDFW